MANGPLTHAPIGFSKDIWEGEVDKKYLCNSCGLILKGPCQGECGHRFCEECVEYILRTVKNGKEVKCPACESDLAEELIAAAEVKSISRPKIFPDNAIKRELARKQTKCLNPSCKWNGPFKEYKNHIEACRVKIVECLVCGAQIEEEKEDKHAILECPKRNVQCPQCEDTIHADEVEDHKKMCPNGNSSGTKISTSASFETLCPYGCKTIVKSPDEYTMHCQESTEKHLYLLRRLILQLKTRPTEVPPDSGIHSSEYGQNSNQASTSLNLRNSEAMAPLTVRISVQEKKMVQYEKLNSVLVREIEKGTHKYDMLERQQKMDRELLDGVERKLRSLERTVALKDITIAEMDLRIQMLESTTYDGCLTWRIPNFSRKKQEAAVGKTTSIYSPVFFTGKKGYKMCGRIYLHGDGMGKGTHVSFFMVVMRGNYDALLPWPFRQKVTFKMLDQNKREDITDTFRPDPTSSSFRRPTSEMNIASGCPMFMPLGLFDNPQYGYVKDDVIFVEIEVDSTL